MNCLPLCFAQNNYWKMSHPLSPSIGASIYLCSKRHDFLTFKLCKWDLNVLIEFFFFLRGCNAKGSVLQSMEAPFFNYQSCVWFLGVLKLTIWEKFLSHPITSFSQWQWKFMTSTVQKFIQNIFHERHGTQILPQVESTQ